MYSTVYYRLSKQNFMRPSNFTTGSPSVKTTALEWDSLSRPYSSKDETDASYQEDKNLE